MNTKVLFLSVIMLFGMVLFSNAINRDLPVNDWNMTPDGMVVEKVLNPPQEDGKIRDSSLFDYAQGGEENTGITPRQICNPLPYSLQ